MLIVIEFIAFILYASLIFFIKKYSVLCIVFFINLTLMALFKVKLKNAVLFIIKLLPFIIFTGILNMILGGLELGIVISLKLILVCNITYIFAENMTPKKLQFAIEKVLMPLKIFGVNTKEIGIMVSISFAFIPIVQKEVQNVKFSLLSKGVDLNFKNFIKRPNLLLVPLIISVIKRISEIEESMISRGYVS